MNALPPISSHNKIGLRTSLPRMCRIDLTLSEVDRKMSDCYHVHWEGEEGACSFLAWQGSLRTLYYHTVCHHLHRFNLHVMMSLAHGKVSESAARLVLAERLLKVGVSWLVETQWFHWTVLFQSISEYAKSNTSTDCKVADVVSI